MPNWVDNTLNITDDDPQVIARLVDQLDGEESLICFGNVVAEQNTDDWYSWRVTNWGTKWDACEADRFLESPTAVSYTFQTAWAPPLPFVIALSKQHSTSTVEIAFEEEQGWGGERTFVAGITTAQRDWDIPESHKEFIDRGRRCYCESGEAVFADCNFWRALDEADELMLELSDVCVDILRGFSPDWRGLPGELLAIARALETP